MKHRAMTTEQLINEMVKDRATRPPFLSSFLYVAVLGVAADALIFFVAVGPRPDIAAAAETWRFLFKFVVTLSLAALATILVYRMAAPAMWRKCRSGTLAMPLGLLVAAVLLELHLVPNSLWMVRMIGSNSVNCITLIPLLALAPLTCFLVLLRRGAPRDPGLTGAIAGLAASAIAATFYALSCFDDSPLFVITWYPIAAAIVVTTGYLCGGRFLVW